MKKIKLPIYHNWPVYSVKELKGLGMIMEQFAIEQSLVPFKGKTYVACVIRQTVFFSEHPVYNRGLERGKHYKFLINSRKLIFGF